MKKFTVVFTSGALTDIENATEYYNMQSAGLGKRFAIHVRAKIKTLKSNPYISSIRYADIRCCIVKDFPFMIHYQINDELNTMNILSVYNTHRDFPDS